MTYTKEKIATMVFQKMTGRTATVDLNNISNNGVQVFNEQYDMLLGVAMQKHTWTWTNCVKCIQIDDAESYESDDPNYTHKIEQPEHLKVLDGVYRDENCVQKLPTRHHDKYIYVYVPEGVETLYLKYVSDPCEAIMPDYFATWLVYFMAAEMTLEVSGDTDKFKILTMKQAEFLKIALAADNKRGGIKTVPTDRYTAVRY